MILIGIFPNYSAAEQNYSTIDVWAFGREGRLLAQLIARFESMNPGCNVKLHVIPKQGIHEKLVTSAIGGNLPDVAHVSSPWVAEFAALNVLEPLNQFIADSSFDEKKILPGMAQSFCYSGLWYGLPWYVGTHLIFYRKDHLAAAGFTTFPRTWNEFHHLCAQLKKLNPQRYPIWLQFDRPGIFQNLLYQNGGEILAEKPDGVISPTSASEKAFAEIDLWRKEGWAPWGAEVLAGNTAGFAEGQYSMLLEGPWVVWALQKEAPQINGQWDTARLPGPTRNVSLLYPCGTVMFRSCKNKPLAWKFMEYLASRQAQLEFFASAGNLPVNLEALEDPAITGTNELKAFCEQIREGRGIPFSIEWPRLSAIIGGLLDELAHGNVSAASAPAILESRMQNYLEDENRKSPSGQLEIVALIVLNVAFLSIVWFLRRGEGLSYTSMALGRLKTAVFFIFPALSIIVLFKMIPLCITFLASMTDCDLYGVANPARISFAGIQQFVSLWRDELFWQALKNTLIFLLFAAPLNIGLALSVALATHRAFARGLAFFRLGFFLPVATTLVSASIVWRWIFHAEHGPVAAVFKALGFEVCNWLEDPQTAIFALVIVSVWKNFGYNMVVFLVMRQNIDPSLFEAAALDGASDLQQCWHITIPSLRRGMIFAVIITSIGSLQLFTEPYIMTRGGPANATLSLVYLLFREGFQYFKFGYASAIAVVLFFLTLMLGMIRQYVRRSIGRQENAS